MPIDTAFTGGLTLTEAQHLLKEYYEPAVRVQFNSDTVLWYMLNKNSEGVSGREVVYSMNYRRSEGYGWVPPGGILPDPHQQQYDDMRFKMTYFYIRLKVDGPVIAASRDNAGAFARGLQSEIEGGVRDGKNRINEALFSDGSGRLAVITNVLTADLTAGKFTVKHPYDEVGAGGQGDNDFSIRPGMCVAIVSLAGAAATATTPEIIGLKTSPSKGRNFQKHFYVETVEDVSSAAAGTVKILLNTDEALTAASNPNWNDDQDGWGMLAGAGLEPVVGDFITRVTLRDDAYLNTTAGGGVVGGAAAVDLFKPYMEYRSQSTDQRTLMGLFGIVSTLDPIYGADNAAYLRTPLQGVAASNVWWQGNVLTHATPGTGRPLSMTLLQQGQDAIERIGNATLNVVVTGYPGRRAYENLIIAQKRFVNTMQIDGGFTALDFNGKPMVVEKDCPAGHYFFLDLAALEVKRQADLTFMDKDGAILTRVPNRDAYEATLFTYMELATPRRNALARLSDINRG
jgi:hypothetical protein